MSDLQQHLALLRRRIARIDRKYANGVPQNAVQAASKKPARYFVEEWLSGQEVENPQGRHFQTERVWERHRRHGSLDISSLAELPDDLLAAISDGKVSSSSPRRWAFLDTETTGLAGGSGTYAFLVGVGSIDERGFTLRQFFMREFREEPSLLAALSEHLTNFDVLITYNGRTYDQPLLETRYRMCRARPPFARMAHVDLLFASRRLWKLRFDSCRLVDLEHQILGVEREGDLPGEMIPYVYFEYLRTLEAFRLVPIFHHNAMDILTLACLTAIVPCAFQSPQNAPLTNGAEMIGLARWLRKAARYDLALDWFRRAIERGLSDELLFRTLWDIAALEKRRGCETAALATFRELAASRNPWRIAALEELAKFYEHREANLATALEFTEQALGIEENEKLRRRATRLKKRLESPRVGRLNLMA